MASRLAEKVLLVGLEGADWSLARPLLEAGELPNLASIVRGGVSGSLTAPQPLVSSLLWTSLATGKRPHKHGILADLSAQGASIGPVSARARRVHALWNLLTHAGLRSVIAGWPATHPAEPIHGAILSDRYAEPAKLWERSDDEEVLHPPRLRALLEELSLAGGELGEAELMPFVPRAPSLEALDPVRLARIASALARDVTLHAAATRLFEKERWSLAAVRYSLIERISRDFMELTAPRMAHVSETDHELYGEAVASAYRFTDRMLGRLIDLAGDDATVLVVSDHGYQTGCHRPRPDGGESRVLDSWRRPRGIVCMRGPRVHQGSRIHGGHLLDVTPTLLALFGLPVGNDMDGSPLLQAFSEPVRLWSIRGWEELPGDFGTLPAPRPGERGRVDPEHDPRVASVRMEELSNLALSHLETGELGRARPLLEELVRVEPKNPTHVFWLAQALHREGARQRAWSLADELASLDSSRLEGELLRGTLLRGEGHSERALEAFRQVESSAPALAGLQVQIGNALLDLGRWRDAESAFRRALEQDADSADAYHGLALACLRLERYAEAAEAALRAVGLQHFFPDAHFHLGVALAHGQHQAAAIRAFETCLELRPHTPEAHRWLGLLHERAYGDREKAAWHQRQLEHLLAAGEPATALS